MKPNPRIHQFKNLKLWFELTQMPPLDHWPNRPEDFDYDNSCVIKHIKKLAQTNSRHAVSLFTQAKKNGCILFEPTTKLWQGNKLWEP